MRKAFSTEGMAHATWPLDHEPLAVFDQFDKRPILAKRMAEGMAGDVAEYERTGKLLEMIPYAWQAGATKWLVSALLQGGTSFLVEGGPGVGKTLILGVIVRAAIREQMAGILEGTVVIIFNKPYIIEQQSFNVADRRERLMEQECINLDRELVMQYSRAVFPPKIAALFSKDVWAALVSQNMSDRAEALAALEDMFRRGKFERSISTYATELRDLAGLLVGDAYLIRDTDPRIPVVLRFSASKARSEGEVSASFSGDLMRGIPQEYVESGVVGTTVAGLNVGSKPVSKLSDEARTNIRVLLTTQGSFDQTGMQGADDIIANADVIVIDEGCRAASTYQARVTDLRRARGIKEGDPPLVFSASALRETNGLLSRPVADAYAPSFGMLESMESDTDGRKIAPDIGLDVFPRDPSATLYRSASHETLQRIADIHFESCEIPDRLGMPQRYAMNTAVVVSLQAVADTVDILREGYENRGIKARVVPFSLPGIFGKEKLLRQQRILAWVLDEDHQDEAEGPKIIVFAEGDFRDSLSIPTITNVLLATGKSMDARTLRRRIGRMCHIDPHGKNVEFRAVISQILTSETNGTVFDVMYDDENRPEMFMPLGVVRGKKGAERDRKDCAGLTSYPVPNAEVLRAMPRAAGRPLTSGSLRPHQDLERCLTVLRDTFEMLRSIARQEEFRLWGFPEVRAALQKRILIEAWFPFRQIIRMNEEEWTQQINRAMCNAWSSAQAMVDAAEGFCDDVIDDAVSPLPVAENEQVDAQILETDPSDEAELCLPTLVSR